VHVANESETAVDRAFRFLFDRRSAFGPEIVVVVEVVVEVVVVVDVAVAVVVVAAVDP